MAGVTVSAILHSVALAGIVWSAHAAAALPRPAAKTPNYVLTFLRVPSAPIEMPAVKLPVRLPAETPKPPVELKAPEPEPAPVARVEPKPLPPTPAPAPAPEPVKAAPPPPKPVPPPVQVGAFADAANVAPNPTPGRQVVNSGFDATPARSPELKLAPSAAVGGFDSVKNTEVPRPGTDKPAGAVVSAGFGGAAPVQRPSAPGGTVAESGFGASAPAQRGGTAARTDVRAGAFDVQPAVREAPARTAAAPVDVPVEILFKPTPAYTDEARAMKLEGDVVLEVEFCASKTVRVLRVVRGMGHGLDESASRAASGIKFKPAQADGRPVDFRTTLHIVFRLT